MFLFSNFGWNSIVERNCFANTVFIFTVFLKPLVNLGQMLVKVQKLYLIFTYFCTASFTRTV